MTDQIIEPATDDEQLEPSAAPAPATATRRSFVSKGALAAAVGAAAGLAMSERASAANNDPVNVGNTETGTNSTVFAGGTTLEGWGGNSSGGAAVYGHTANSLGGSTRGVHGSFDGTGANGVGVYGSHDGSGSPGVGVYGNASQTISGNIGVQGDAWGNDGSIGMRGRALGTRGVGVSGEATTSGGTGVSGDGDAYDFEAVGSGRIRFSTAVSSDVSASSTGSVGTLARNSNGSLWYCYSSNSWREISAAPPSPSTDPTFTAATPFRVYDSRLSGGRFAGDENRTISCADAIDVSTGAVTTANALPSGATAVAANVTVIGPTTNGFASVNPGGDAVIKASVVNYVSGQNIANAGIFSLNGSRELEAIFGPGGGGHLAIDITGYWV